MKIPHTMSDYKRFMFGKGFFLKSQKSSNINSISFSYSLLVNKGGSLTVFLPNLCKSRLKTKAKVVFVPTSCARQRSERLQNMANFTAHVLFCIKLWPFKEHYQVKNLSRPPFRIKNLFLSGIHCLNEKMALHELMMVFFVRRRQQRKYVNPRTIMIIISLEFILVKVTLY